MCGIAGGVFWGGSTDSHTAKAAVSAMVDAERHRGPDGEGLFASQAAGSGDTFAVFGHTRLAIIDVSPAGAQPMGGGPGAAWITFNGEIYNFARLRSELEGGGATFQSRSDTEVLLRGYDAWGRDLLPRLRGMFAFALWDPQRRQLLIARDRLGIKPIYFYRGDGFLLFASEIRALLSTGLVPRRLDPDGVLHYLGYQSVPTPRTLVDGVRALEPASWMTLDENGGVESGQYWRMLDAASQVEPTAPDAAAEKIGDLLRDAVDAHMVSDVPVAAFLSGGIDSSAIVALMRDTGHTPRTFSVGFDEQAFDESTHAALVAATFKTDHAHIQLRGDELLAQLPEALGAMDQPSGDGINTWVVAGAVSRRGIKVALSGLGGDEIFGGYPSFSRLMRVADYSRVWGRSPAPIRSLAAGAVRALGRSSIQATKAAAMLESDGEISSMFPLTRQLLSAGQRDAVISSSLLARVADRTDPYERLLTEAFTAAPAASTFARISFAEARTYMHDVLLRDTDQMCMAHALEARVPLLDHELIEAVMRLPDAVKWPSTSAPKPLLVAALGGRLPDSIVHRPKQGFALPFAIWMRGPLKAFCERHLGDNGLAGRALLDAAETRQLWTAFLSGSRDVSWSRLWMLVALDDWLERTGVA